VRLDCRRPDAAGARLSACIYEVAWGCIIYFIIYLFIYLLVSFLFFWRGGVSGVRPVWLRNMFSGVIEGHRRVLGSVAEARHGIIYFALCLLAEAGLLNFFRISANRTVIKRQRFVSGQTGDARRGPPGVSGVAAADGVLEPPVRRPDQRCGMRGQPAAARYAAA
jgi:hypothetical protein